MNTNQISLKEAFEIACSVKPKYTDLQKAYEEIFSSYILTKFYLPILTISEIENLKENIGGYVYHEEQNDSKFHKLFSGLALPILLSALANFSSRYIVLNYLSEGLSSLEIEVIITLLFSFMFVILLIIWLAMWKHDKSKTYRKNIENYKILNLILNYKK
ncbi:hypothetical protein ACQV2T_06700 [Facklamia sp. P13069]|uniref:hypothetical protein n=1 Tax=Facklamia sp. P13069 TaxID=3421954 RepID=UPI003D17AB4A